MGLKEKIEAINKITSGESWFDFEVMTFDGGDLVVKGSIDFSYSHILEITFHDVFHMSLNTEWKSDTAEPVFGLVTGEEAVAVNRKFQVEQGNYLFKFAAEDFEQPFYIAARDLSFNNDTVYYFHKENLGPGERVAEWVDEE